MSASVKTKAACTVQLEQSKKTCFINAIGKAQQRSRTYSTYPAFNSLNFSIKAGKTSL
jgi:hypothetical protein